MKISSNPQALYRTYSNKSENQPQKPLFTSNCVQINKQRKHFTYFFRDDLQWKNFVKYLDKQFLGADKVNIHNLACSDGTESYTLVMSLLSKLGEDKSKKFLPIMSSDINSEVILTAKSGNIPLLTGLYKFYDYYKLKMCTFLDKPKHFKISKQDKKTIVNIDDICKNNIRFKTADLFKEIDNMEGENTVVLCRNVWMYLSVDEQILAAEKLGKKLQKNSSVVLGEYDKGASDAVELLNKNGFEETYIDYVFEKV